MILPRLYTESPPDPRTRLANNPSLLFSWWCTGFAMVIILLRVGGRYVRVERLFVEDKIMFWSLIPLFIRMALVHVILIYGTNNVNPTHLDPTGIKRRAIGAKLVLASRIFYAMFIWVAKWAVLEFLKRTVSTSWTRSYERGIRAIRLFLVCAFIAVVIATLAECQPFDHYWQVVPTPTPHCRQGFAQLIAMSTADIITDVLLIVFPIFIVARSALTIKRKLILASWFSLSAVLIAITAYRVPAVIERKGRQQFRSVLASCEIVAAAAVANAVILGSFLRDRGVKKNKYRAGSVAESVDRTRTSTCRPTITAQHWGSDEDLFKDMCYRLGPGLQSAPTIPRPPPMAMTAMAPKTSQPRKDSVMDMRWHIPKSEVGGNHPEGSKGSIADTTTALEPDGVQLCRMSFADVGGLLGPSAHGDAGATTLSLHTVARDFAPQSRRGSRAPLADLSVLSSSLPARRASTNAQGSPQPQISTANPDDFRHDPSA